MNPKRAGKIMLWLLLGIMLLHVSIMLKIIPYEITWGGRLKNDSEMYVFETISIVINLFLSFLLLIKGHFIREVIPLNIVNAFLWIFLVLFVLNTLGNLMAQTNFEKYFSVLTLALSYLIWVIMTKRNTKG